MSGVEHEGTQATMRHDVIAAGRQEADAVEVRVAPRPVVYSLLVVLAGVNVVHVATAAIGGYNPGGRVRDLLSMNQEASIGQWYNAILLVFVAVLALAAGLHHRGGRQARYWIGLAAVFAYLSADEMSEIHERVGGVIGDRVDGGFATFSILPGLALLVVMAGLYARFLTWLPRLERRGTVVAAALYVTGAVVLEVVAEEQAERSGLSARSRWFLETVEENLEMLGLVVFAGVILLHLARARSRVHVHF